MFFRRKKDMIDNLKEGRDFLSQNAKRENVIVTESGLQYEVLKKGEGDETPNSKTVVTCHYEGRLINGKIFDSSYKRNQTTSFPLNRVIAGWTEGLQLMNKGSKYRFYIPSELGYGNRAMGRDIPANSTLIFDVELIDF
ncbi:MAG TPA: FKBP-type peptidyl-prolyl cis-trans isomerase [Chitinophagaceae bacterium]|nr:FKBP-type peptidyl-prolyl cis-trans isomerase [Chitinophagaceae bacterium]